MPEALTKVKQQFSEFWGNLDKSQKNRIYITSAILIVAIAAGLFMLTRTNYVTIVSSSNPKEIKEMLTVLEEKNIKPKVVNGSIAVDSKDKNKAEMELMLAGYPKGGMTFEDAFNMIKINTTETDKKKLWEQYKKQSLIAKLMMFENVEKAEVELALPEPSLFDKDQKPTAVAIITPKGKGITPEQAANIAKVVAGSVVNLDPKNVTVVDNNSNTLTDGATDEFAAKTSTQEEMRLNKAKEMEKRVYTLFSGPSDSFDTIKVVVNPVLDFAKQETQTQGIKNPDGMDGGAVISTEKSSEKLVNDGANGVPGTDTNPGGTNAPTYQIGNGDNSSYDKKNEKANYDYTRYTTKEEKPVGGIIPEQSTAALTLWYGKRVTDDSRITNELMDGLALNVSKALGIPVQNISINKFKLAPEQAAQKPVSETLLGLLKDYGFYLLILLMVIALVIIALPRKKREEEAVSAYEQVAAVYAEPQEPVAEIDTEERSEIKKQIEKFVKQKPDAVAQLLRNWLSDDWE